MARKSRVRRSAQQTRDLMVAEGLRMLQSQGLEVGVDHITLEAACVAGDIPRSSSHSAWAIDDDYTPQVTFQRAVLREWLLKRESSMFADAAQNALLELFADPDSPPSSTMIVRTATQAAFKEGYRVHAEPGDIGGDYLSTDMALRYTIASQPPLERDAEVLGWLRDGEMANRADRIEDSYKPLGTLLGMQPKPVFGELAFVFFGIAVAALIEGIGLRNSILPELQLDKPLYDDDSCETPPLLIGLCVEALVPVFFELVSAE